MRILLSFILVVVLLSPVLALSECLKDGENVAFTGKISRETFPGPPNYESIDDGDTPETYWILTINSPKCVVAESIDDGSLYEVAKSTTRFQLAFDDPAIYKQQKTLVEKNASVTGQLFVGHTGHHHTKALISVKSIKAEKK